MKSVIVDIDHTVSDAFWRDERIPKERRGTAGDWDYYHSGQGEDKPLEDVVDLVRLLNERYLIVAVTARPERWRASTVQWMARHRIPWDVLLMRPDADYTMASELKPRLVQEHFTGIGTKDWKEQIAFVLDDSAKIVEQFAALGLTAMRVHARRSG